MKKLMLLCLVSFLSVALFAEGFQVNLLSSKQTGMGHVGTGMKLGSESMHFNPAGLVFLDKSVDLSLGMAAIFANAKLVGVEKTNFSVSTPMYAYAGFKIYDNLAAGISFTTPYGSYLEWPKNWAGAHLIQDIDLKSYVLQPTISWKIVDKLSIGAGLDMAWGQVALSRAMLPVGYLTTVGMGEEYSDVVPVAAKLSGNTTLRVGYNIGIMFDASEKITIGVSYRSKIRMKVKEGDVEQTYASDQIKTALDGQIPPLDQGTFHASLPLPSNVNLGISYRPSEKWELGLDFQFVGWKAYDSLNIYFNQKVLTQFNIMTKKDYKNTMIYRVGAQYKATERLDLRAGIYLDQSPIRKDHYNPETPGMNKLGFSAGLSFEPYRNLSIDFAFLYIQGISRNGYYPDGANTTFGGKYKGSAYAPTIGIAYKF